MLGVRFRYLLPQQNFFFKSFVMSSLSSIYYCSLLHVLQVLRTLEVNCGLWHGQIGIEEHGEFAKLAGSVVGFLGMIGGAAVPNRNGQNNNNGAEEVAAVTRDKV